MTCDNCTRGKQAYAELLVRYEQERDVAKAARQLVEADSSNDAGTYYKAWDDLVAAVTSR